MTDRVDVTIDLAVRWYMCTISIQLIYWLMMSAIYVYHQIVKVIYVNEDKKD